MRGVGNAVFPLVLVSLLAALTFWLEQAANPEDPGRRALKRHDPDFIIGGVNLRHFAETGELKQSLQAETLVHYPDDNTTEVSNPELSYHLGQQPTRVQAKAAQVSDDNKRVDLHGDVRLIKPATTDKPMTTMQTEALTVFPEEDIAQGKSRVTITQGKSVVSGDSIHYNGRTNIAVLGGRVKGTFYRAGKS